MTVLVVNHRMMKSIIMLPLGISPKIKFDPDTAGVYFCQEVKWTVAMYSQLSTFSVLDVGCVHNLPHTLLSEKDTYYLPGWKQRIPNALRRIQCRGDQNSLLLCLILIE